MLYVKDVYNLLLDELRVDKRGLSCEPDEFNRLIRLVNQEVYNDYADKFEKDIDSTHVMGIFKVYNYLLVTDAVTGKATLPTNYYRIIGKPRTTYNSTTRYVDLVTSFEHGCREEDFLSKSSLLYPTCRIGGMDASGNMELTVSPAGITGVYIDYLKSFDGVVTNVPFLDYYINDTTLVTTFLSETATLQAVPVGSTYRDKTPGTGVASTISLTKDMIWGEDELPLILTKLVNRMAKQLPDELLLKTSDAEQAKSDAE